MGHRETANRASWWCRIAALLCAMMLAFGALGFAAGCHAKTDDQLAFEEAREAAEEAGRTFVDGTYTGSGEGQSGAITVTLTIANDHIAVADITDPGEIPGLGGAEAIADGTYKEQIEAAQSSQIEGVSGLGADITSQGVRDAVDDALDQARV